MYKNRLYSEFFCPGTFLRYSLTGILNTSIHWTLFFLSFTLFGCSQAGSNAVAFIFAVTVSFFINARWTFSQPVSLKRYVMWISAMALMALGTGWGGDLLVLDPFVTLIVFSAISLILGFLVAKRFVFR